MNLQLNIDIIPPGPRHVTAFGTYFAGNRLLHCNYFRPQSTLDLTITDVSQLGNRLYTTVAPSCTKCELLSPTSPRICYSQILLARANTPVLCNSNLPLSQPCRHVATTPNYNSRKAADTLQQSITAVDKHAELLQQ